MQGGYTRPLVHVKRNFVDDLDQGTRDARRLRHDHHSSSADYQTDAFRLAGRDRRSAVPPHRCSR